MIGAAFGPIGRQQVPRVIAFAAGNEDGRRLRSRVLLIDKVAMCSDDRRRIS
jgi:hypothetical protein